MMKILDWFKKHRKETVSTQNVQPDKPSSTYNPVDKTRSAVSRGRASEIDNEEEENDLKGFDRTIN